MTYQKDDQKSKSANLEEKSIPVPENDKDHGSNIEQDLQKVRAVVAILEESSLSEVEYRSGDFRVRAVKYQVSGANHPVIHTVSSDSNPISDERRTSAHQSNDVKPVSVSSDRFVKSPMVGTVYLSPKPGDAPFTAVDSMVQEGQPILIIEAMKTMNIIKSPISGRVRGILVQNGEPVEFGQSLVHIE